MKGREDLVELIKCFSRRIRPPFFSRSKITGIPYLLPIFPNSHYSPLCFCSCDKLEYNLVPNSEESQGKFCVSSQLLACGVSSFIPHGEMSSGRWWKRGKPTRGGGGRMKPDKYNVVEVWTECTECTYNVTYTDLG